MRAHEVEMAELGYVHEVVWSLNSLGQRDGRGYLVWKKQAED